MKYKNLKVFAGILFLSTAVGITGCSKSSSQNQEIKFSEILDENSDRTCLDEYLADCKIGVTIGDDYESVPVIDMLDMLEEKIAIYEVLSHMEMDDELGIEKESLEYSLDDVVLKLELLKRDELSPEQRIEFAKELYSIKVDCENWLLKNSDNILEGVAMSTVKCSALDALDLTEKSYDKVTITSYEKDPILKSDIIVSDYDVDDKGSLVTDKFAAGGNLCDLVYDIYTIQSNYYNGIGLKDSIEDYKDVIKIIKNVIKMDKEVKSGVLQKTIVLK